jgi:DNA replication licensing factor MCM4
LRSSLIKEYAWYYIAYESLKDALKTPYQTEPTPQNPNPKRKPWTEDDEKRFVALLESELEKVFCFQKEKSDEVVGRIKASEQDVREVVTRLDSSSSDESTDADFLLLEGVLSEIIADVHDLAKYTQLNYTGFQKIIKKHDVGLSFPFPLPSESWFHSGADYRSSPFL